jgi:GntR family histidine utilization transcriptional repressor
MTPIFAPVAKRAGAGLMHARPTPLSERILADITGKIVSGELPPGHRIPFEMELAAQYRCSRMTVNKALTQLARNGLIERRRRSGSFVARPRSQAAILDIHDIRTEVEALGRPYRYELLSRRERRAIAIDRDRINVPPGNRLIELSCRHLAGDRPFCLEERLISLAAVPAGRGESFADTAPGPWLLAHVPWTAAEHAIRAAGATSATAAALDLAENSPCLVVERRTWSGGEPVTFVRLTYDGDSHALVARFAPS